jgi:protein phosphatase
MKAVWAAVTDTGIVRRGNEDAHFTDEGIFAVADGMGGHNAGEVASALAVNTLRAALRGGVSGHDELRNVIQRANTAIYTASLDDSAQQGMGTTLTVIAAVHGRTDLVLVANVGDSRAYLYRDDMLERVTVDHSYVQDLVTEGIISAEDARNHPRKNIVTRALGIDRNVEVDISPLQVRTGDRLLVCSDGLVDEVDDHDIGRLLGRHGDAREAAEVLVSQANSSGGRDNITVVVVDVTDAAHVTPVPSGANPDTAEMDVLTAISNVLGDHADGAGKSRTRKVRLPRTRPRLSAGVAMFWTAAAVILLSVLTAFGVYGRTGFFLAEDSDGMVSVYRGRPGGVLWFDPTMHRRSGVLMDQLPDAVQREVRNNRSFSKASSALQYLQYGYASYLTTVLTTTTTTILPTTTLAPPS